MHFDASEILNLETKYERQGSVELSKFVQFWVYIYINIIQAAGIWERGAEKNIWA